MARNDESNVLQILNGVARWLRLQASKIIVDPAVEGETDVQSALEALSANSGGGGWVSITKAENTTRISTSTLEADPELSFLTTAGTAYELEGMLYWEAVSGTPDIKFAFGEDTTIRGGVNGIGTNPSTGNVQLVAAGTNQIGTLQMGTLNGRLAMSFWGVHTGAGGTFSILWAQNTLTAENIILLTGSQLRYRAVS